MTPSVVMLAFAQRGRRLFTNEDARLADQVLDQLTRAVAFDAAVERGRREERMRIAQDLHDDIGARLLTLMYQAPTREMEDYLRHTLKDLKTLTRGLAAPNHRLSHAVAEWKADISQRLAAADCELGWSFTYDRDFELSVVQWSALTRVLRELVSNAIAHAKATHVDHRCQPRTRCTHVERDRQRLRPQPAGLVTWPRLGRRAQARQTARRRRGVAGKRFPGHRVPGRDSTLCWRELTRRDDARKKKGQPEPPADPHHLWSGWRDSNSRPLAPHASALPGCATPRRSAGV